MFNHRDQDHRKITHLHLRFIIKIKAKKNYLGYVLVINKYYSMKKEKLYNKKIFITGINQSLELQIKVNYLTIIKPLKLEDIIH